MLARELVVKYSSYNIGVFPISISYYLKVNTILTRELLLNSCCLLPSFHLAVKCNHHICIMGTYTDLYRIYICTYMYKVREICIRHERYDAMRCELVQLARPHAMKMTNPEDDPGQRGGHKGLTSTNRW